METVQIRELIQQWRLLNNDLKGKNQELEKAQESLHEYDGKFTKAKQEWDLEKEKLLNTINAVLSDVKDKKAELQAIEKESAELRGKVNERRKRNEEHLVILNRRRKAVEDQLKEAEARDAGVKERYIAFQASRSERKEQLLAAIKKCTESLPQEREEHEKKMSQLKDKILETKAIMEAEAKSWAREQALYEWNKKSDARKWLLEEINSAERGKDIWADLLQESNSFDMNDYFKTLKELRTVLSS